MTRRIFTLTPRLAACAGLVRVGSRLADIGTDHAKLPVWLAKQGLIQSAVACDISPGAIANADKTVAAHDAGNVVKTRISNGLTGINPDEIDDIVIAGMGGELIAKILPAVNWIKNDRYNLIFQPMSRPERLRLILLGGHFNIIREIAVREGGRIYLVIQARYSNPENPDNPLFFTHPCTGLLPYNGDRASRDYLMRQVKLFQAELIGCRLRGDSDRIRRLEEYIPALEKALNEMD